MFGDNFNKPAKTSYKPQEPQNSQFPKNKSDDKFQQLVYRVKDISSKIFEIKTKKHKFLFSYILLFLFKR